MSSGSGRQGKAGLGQVTKRSFTEFSADDMITYATAVSYQVFFSLFPSIISNRELSKVCTKVEYR